MAAVTQEQRKGLLGVETSLRGRRWEMRGGDERLALALSQRLGLPEILGRVLAGRGVGLEEAEGFLNPTLRDLLPDPSSPSGTPCLRRRSPWHPGQPGIDPPPWRASPW